MDSSDYESDAGASPSVSDSDATSVSSRSSSPGALKIVCVPLSTPRKKPTTTSKTSQSSPSVRQSRKKTSQTPSSCSNNTKNSSSTPAKSNKPVPPNVRAPRKRKRADESQNSTKQPRATPSTSRNNTGNKRIKMNQRRRTKSERNTRAGKAPVVEETVVLDAEIDKFLEDKAMKNNLTATNVKSIIRHVITNNMVQKMVMSTVKNKTGNPDESSDEEAYFEPKLTRARTKLLLEKQTSPHWPIVASPVKTLKKPMSETHALIHEELPEDSSGDEEYLPREDETHSDDESSSVASHASDAGSPKVSTPLSSTRAREALARCGGTPTDSMSLFKTPPPLKPKCVRRINDSAIGRRTRSKLPLNDTALEDLEMQLIPPDITPDMYDWGLSDNEDYLAFVKEFLCPGQNNVNNEAGDDDEADPEYNVMEDEEEHDKEELRMDRAVKVSKKELNELVAELMEESHFTSGEELDETDYSSFCTGQISMSGIHEFVDYQQRSQDSSTKLPTVSAEEFVEQKENTVQGKQKESEKQSTQSSSAVINETCISEVIEVKSPETREEEQVSETTETISEPCSVLPAPFEEIHAVPLPDHNLQLILPPEPENLFSIAATATVRHQMRQHIQLLAQSYVLTAFIEEPYFKDIARASKKFIVELNNFSAVNGPNSHFRVANLDPAWQVVNSWPHKSSARTPIKKKILEEKYINDYQNKRTDESSQPSRANIFPRHVVKVIAESPAFCYPELLPMVHNQNSKAKCTFMPSEDTLLIYGFEDLKHHSEIKLKDKLKLVSAVLLPAKTPDMLYHRFRNLKKSAHKSSVPIKLYFKEGKLPPGAIACEYETFTCIPPIAQLKENLPQLWRVLISKLAFFSELNWKSESDFDDASKSKKTNMKKNKRSPAKKTIDNVFVVTSTFPSGIEMVQHQMSKNPDLTAVPLLNVNGDPGAYMFIPKYAMPPPGYNNSPKGTEASESRKYHPIPLYEATRELLVTQTINDEKDDGSVLSFTPVGKPFRLQGIDSDVINLASLDTPLKKAIMEHVQEATPTKVYERTEQSARTLGNYIRGSSKSQKDLSEEDFESSDDDSTKGFVEDDEDVNLTEYEESFGVDNSETTEGEIVCLEILEESEDEIHDTKSPCSFNYELQDAGESRARECSKSKNEKENSGARDTRETTEDNSRVTESAGLNRNGSRIGGQSGQDEEDDDDDEIHRSKGVLPEDPNEDVEREEDTEEEPETTPSSTRKPSTRKQGSARNPKKYKRSLGGASPPKKRTPKTTPVEKMLEEDKERDGEVCDAFMHAFLLKVQTVTEARNPGLHNEFLKVLSDAVDIESEMELLARVQSLLKDYPELVAEFATFVDTDKSVPVEDTNFSDYQEMQAQFNFIRHLEKFTENSPQLKAKILHKFKVLKEEQDLSEKDVAEGLAPFFQGNLVMMDAFKALFPSIYRPESIADANDFEEVDMEMDDPTGQDDPNMEFVKLPEEKNVPATNTCGCTCHDTRTHAYSSRVKHCSKCCIKFQDGKVFVHNGRVIRPVNVELKSPTAARKILSGNSCHNCIQEPSKTKESSTLKSKDEQILKTKSDDVDTLTSAGEEDDIEDGEILEEDEIDQQGSQHPVTVVEKASEEKACDSKVSLMPWKIEEDHLILSTCQSEPTLEDAFSKLTSILSNRDITEIESRCVELISLLQQTITSTEESEVS